MPGAVPAIELRGIDKRFGAVHANRDIDLTVARGSVHGIVGENGAGKSTLMSILYGFYQADRGDILIDGQLAIIRDSAAAIAAGIGMVHQHFMLVESFSVLENIVLGVEGSALLAPGKARARTELAHLAREYAMDVDLDAIVGDLPVGQQQRVEILKALYRGAAILVLDEPTAVLTPQEADHLFRILRLLRDHGTTIILITEDGGLAGCEGQDQAHAVAVFRYMGQTEMAQFAWIAPQAPSRHGLTVQYHAAIGYRPDAGDGLQQFALPISGYTGNADDLAGAY